MRYAAADFKEDYSILIFTKQLQITMINAARSIEYIYTGISKNSPKLSVRKITKSPPPS